MLIRISIISIILILSLGLLGCNIFSWTDSPSEDEDLIAQGLELMEEGKYEEAAVKFAEAKERDPLNSDARYNHAKASLLASGFSIVTIIQELSKADNFDENAGLPFFSWPLDTMNLIYTTNYILLKDLLPIYEGSTHGGIVREDILLDMTIIHSIIGVLRFADTNGDSLINEQDVNLSIFRQEGGYTFENLYSLASNPEFINGMINNAVASLGTVIGIIFSEVIDTTETSIDMDMINSLMQDVENSASMFYTQDGEDNDGDWYDTNGNGQEDVMVWTDANGDGKIDDASGNPLPAPYTGPYTGEFQGGDWGVDEEKLDGVDNDGDGWIDEDSGLH